MAENDLTFEQPRSHFGTWLGVLLLFGVFALFVWVVIGASPRRDHYEEKRGEARMEKLKTAREEADPQLHTYGWVDKAKGSAHIPIARAMDLEMAELAQKKPAPAGPIDPNTKPGLQDGAPVNATPAPATRAEPRPTAHPAIAGKNSEMEGQANGSANPPNAAPGTQPGPSNTPSAGPGSGANQPQPGPGKPTATPMQVPAGTPIPIPGKAP